MRDVFDLPALDGLLRQLHRRELSLVEVETPRASPFASSLLFDYVATYMYEGDTPNAERRAAALSLDRDLLRELLGQEELRELIDPEALAEVEADLQRLSDRTRAANADALHDVLRALGDLTASEAQARCLDGVSAAQVALARLLPAWQGVDSAPPGGAGVDRLREILVPLQGVALAPEVWENDVLPRRVGAYSPTWLDQLCSAGELVWVGAGALGRHSGKVALYFREDARWLGPPPTRGEPPAEELHDTIRERLERGAAFWTDLLADIA